MKSTTSKASLSPYGTGTHFEDPGPPSRWPIKSVSMDVFLKAAGITKQELKRIEKAIAIEDAMANAKDTYTKDELKWARKEAKKLGIKDPKVFLEMRWSEVTKLCREKGLDWVIMPAPKKKPRRASASRPKKPSSASSSGTSRSKA